MRTAFVDTGAWVALTVARDANHRRATELFRTIATDVRLVTSNMILSESYTWLAYNRQRHRALHLRNLISRSVESRLLRIAWVTQEVDERAWSLFERYSDQVFSFVDCTSFVLAREESVDFVFGFDRDFVTMGFDLRPGLV